jgi:hypothetical protein
VPVIETVSPLSLLERAIRGPSPSDNGSKPAQEFRSAQPVDDHGPAAVREVIRQRGIGPESQRSWQQAAAAEAAPLVPALTLTA